MKRIAFLFITLSVTIMALSADGNWQELFNGKKISKGGKILTVPLNTIPRTARVNGYQVECDDHADRSWVGSISEEASRGWLYPMSYNQDSCKAFRTGEWNQLRIKAIGSTIRTYINGVSFANLVDDAHPEGFIALQVYGIGDKQELEQHKDIPHSPEVSFLDNQLTENQINQGWELFWDGKTTDGWRGVKLDKFPDKGWIMEDGVL